MKTYELKIKNVTNVIKICCVKSSLSVIKCIYENINIKYNKCKCLKSVLFLCENKSNRKNMNVKLNRLRLT